MLGASVDGLFPVLLYFTTIENDVIYYLTVRLDVISRYVSYASIPFVIPLLRKYDILFRVDLRPPLRFRGPL